MASELRQRKGAEAKDKVVANDDPKSVEESMELFQNKMRSAIEAKVRGNAEEGSKEEDLQKQIQEECDRMFGPKKKPLPGVNNQTKEAKDALAHDPYNLMLMMQLGTCYTLEEKYTEATNVLMRGWKRVGEFEKPEQRFVFLLQLAHASFNCKKYKQALAVIMDVEEPEDSSMYTKWCCMECKVYAHNDQLQKSLKAFNKALEKCKDLDEAMPVWLETLTSLKKIGAYEAAKPAITKLAKTDEDKQRLDACEALQTMRSYMDEASDEAEAPRVPKPMLMGLIAVGAFFIIWLLYTAEVNSLKSMKLNN